MKAFHDVHIHNYLSSCSHDNGATVESYIELSKQNGLRLMGFANHTWDETVPFPYESGFYKRQSMAFQMQIKAQIPEDTGNIKVLVGAETEYCGMYDVLGMGKDAALQLDFLLIPHTHVHMRDFVMPRPADMASARENLKNLLLERIPELTPERALAMSKLPENELLPFITGERVDYVRMVSDFMVESFRSLMNNEVLKSYSDLIPVSVAHPFQPVGSEKQRMDMVKLISDETYGELFTMAATRGIGLEINTATNNDEDARMFGIAKECGCKFTLGSDAHSRSGLASITRTEALTERLGLTEYDMMDFTRA